jgi:hypothetical protein
MADNLAGGSTVSNFTIWHAGNDKNLLRKIKLDGDITGDTNFDNDGNCVISTSTDKLLPLTGGTISGNLTVTDNLSAGNITETSAKRFKENIVELKDSLSKVKQLTGVSYNWIKDNKKDIGFIAEDVYQVVPEVVDFNIMDEVQGLNYGKLTSHLVNAIKEIDTRLEKIENILNISD